MRSALEASLAPTTLDLTDESARHAGHAGASPEGETHFRLRLVSARFEGLSRVARQRLVNEALSAEFAGGLHALAMELKTPSETA
ncbi:MAG: BolA family protein [Pseudomonadota bacterium]